MIDQIELGHLWKYLSTHPGLNEHGKAMVEAAFNELSERRRDQKSMWLVCEHGGLELRCCTSCLDSRYISALTDMVGDVRTLQHAVKELLQWVPETIDVSEYNKKRSAADTQWPLATEAHSYVLFGKDTGRTYMALLHRVASAAGVDRDAVIDEKCREIEAANEMHAEIEKRRAERRKTK